MNITHIVTFAKPLGLHDVTEARAHDRKRMAQENLLLLRNNLHEKFKMMEDEGIFEGITVHSKIECPGNIVVSGPQDKIDALKEYLTLKDLGSIEGGADEIAVKGANPVIV